MMKLTLILACVLLSTVPLPASADFFGIGDFLGDILGDATEPMIGNAKDAMIQAEKYFADNVVPALISKLDTLGNKMLDQVDQDVQKTVDHIKLAMNDTIHEAAKVAEELADHEVDYILSAVETVLDKVDGIIDKFFQDVDNLLDKLSQLVKQVDCSVEGVSQTWINVVRAAADDGLFPNVFEKCRWELNLGLARVTSLDDYTLYKYWKCKLLEKFTEKSPQDDILAYIGQGQLTAVRFRCISRMSPAMSQAYTKEFVHWGEMYNAWNIDAWPHVESTNQLLISSVVNSGCSDMMDCYTKAMEKLEQANQKYVLAVQTVQKANERISQLESKLQQAQNQLSEVASRDWLGSRNGRFHLILQDDSGFVMRDMQDQAKVVWTNADDEIQITTLHQKDDNLENRLISVENRLNHAQKLRFRGAKFVDRVEVWQDGHVIGAIGGGGGSDGPWYTPV